MYRLLLRLYPASFRMEYGAEMTTVFQSRIRQASGPTAKIAVWLSAFADTLFNALALHWDILRQDLRYTWRTLRRSPGFAITATLVVALGVGANTAAFSIADFVLLRPLPFHDPDRLIKIWQNTPGYSRLEPSPPNYRDWKALSKSFEGMAAFFSNSANLVGQGEPTRLEITQINAELVPLLGVQPMRGRAFTAADDQEGAPGTVLLSFALWKSRFGADESILGRKVLLNDEAYEVVGVMPPTFNFPSRETELWTPLRLDSSDTDRTNNYLQVLARLKPGVSIEQARAEMAVIASQLQQQYPKENEQTGANVIQLRDEVSRKSRMLLYALCGAALCVLLIACANMANLLLARALARQKELAVRSALGAGRERMIRQMMTESLVLAAMGGSVGLVVASVAIPLLGMLVPNSLPTEQMPSLDLRMMIFAAALTTLTGILFGILPALRVSGKGDLVGLREGSRSGGLRKERVRSALVVGEVTASVILLVCAGLLLRALWRVQATDPGFRTDNILTMRTALPIPKYGETKKRKQFYDRVLGDVRQLPGVNNAAYISFLPMVMRGGIWPATVKGFPTGGRRDSNTASLRYVTPGFFATLGIPLIAGRDVSESDGADKPFVAVVSESFARRYWPNESPLGHHFDFAMADRTIIGVVRDIRVRGLEQESEPQVYVSSAQVPDNAIIGYTPKDLVIHASGNLASLTSQVRDIIHRVDPSQPISNVQTMEEIVQEETGSRTVQVRVLLIFAGVAFVLAAVGIYGVLSFAVSQRAREIGVRMALGAQSKDIFQMVFRQGIFLAIFGLIPGVFLAYSAGRTLQALLAGVTPRDPGTFITATLLCLFMTMLGAMLPAVRASRVNPITVMRSE
jgi:predicted permease